jgi:hypothetical protein
MLPSRPIPRPEYPRPDRQRGFVEGIDWLNLNGPWQFRFDGQRSGIDEKWYELGGPDWREQIIVPFCWESLAAWGEGDAAGNDNYYATRVFLDPVSVTRENHRSSARYEVGWYRRWVDIPDHPSWKNKRPILTIGAADFFTDVWCNGVHLGRREGGYVAHEFDLSPALANVRSRRALVVVRVEDPMDNHEQPVGKQWGWYTPTSGIWQTVFLEPRAPACIDHFRIFPDVDNSRVLFDIECENVAAGTKVIAQIRPPDGLPFDFELKLEGNMARGSTKLTPLHLWDPSSPKLYKVTFKLVTENGDGDVVHGYFGMRKIHTEPAHEDGAPAMLCLNNKPIYLRGALYQSYFPDGVYTARDAQVLRDDIAFARESGFDFLRIHIKLDDPLVLHYADTVGMLLMQDFPNFGEGGDTELGRRRFEEMMRLGFKRDFNHPSIIAWCLFNETWGFGGQNELMKFIAPGLSHRLSSAAADKIANSPSFKWVHEMWQIAKTIDPTRLIEDMSVVVWEHLAAYGHVDTDINSWHFYIDKYEKARAHIADVVAKSYRGSNFNYVEGYQQSGAPLINSEYGGVGALDGDRDISWTFKFLTNELRRHVQLSAYIFTQLTDVEWEYNGLLNYDRTRKQFGYHPTLINQGDVLPIDAPPISILKPGATVEVDVFSSHFSRRVRENVTLHWHYTGLDSTAAHHQHLDRGWIQIPFTAHRVELARRIKITVPRERMLCTLYAAAVNGDGETIAQNYIQHFISDGPPARQEERRNMLILRRSIEEWHDAQWTGAMTSRVEALSRRSCAAHGAGYFEWKFEHEALSRLAEARRVRILCEVSSRRPDTPQTDTFSHQSEFELLINDLPIHRATLPNHPHDTRGALSFLHNKFGAYGYLVNAACEDLSLQQLASSVRDRGALYFRCAVPGRTEARNGLTVYGYDCGRYPICPTVIIEWDQDARRLA